MVSASAGSIALLLTDIIAKHGMAYMIYATLLAGIFQLIFGVCNIHKLIDYLPKSVMQGFVNALAIMILLAQLKQVPHQSLAAIIMVIISIKGSVKTNRQGSHLLATAKRKIGPHVNNCITRRRGAAWH